MSTDALLTTDSTDSVDATVDATVDAKAGARRTRPAKGAKFAALRHFLLDTYGQAFLASGSGVLDVAGGQGTLAWELLNYHGVPVTVVDPRRSTRARKFERRFEYQQRKRMGEPATAASASSQPRPLVPRHWPTYWRDELWTPLQLGADEEDAQAPVLSAIAEALRSRPVQPNSARRTRKGYFAAGGASADEAEADGGAEEASAPAGAALPAADEAWRVLRDCSIAVGMHPDSATESLIDFALAHNKPFAVVPCCVCAVDFPQRRLRDTSYRGFVEYLIAKAPERIRVAELPGFEGRNLCLYSVVEVDERLPAARAEAATCGACEEG